jgi:WD40 repeat protein
LLATYAREREFKVWDIATGKERMSLAKVHERAVVPVNHLAFSPDGRTLAAGSGKGLIVLWTLDPKADTLTFSTPKGFTTLTLAPTGRTVVATTREKTVRVYDLTTRKERPLNVLGGIPTAVAVSPDGATLAVGLRRYDDAKHALVTGGEWQLWDLRKDQLTSAVKDTGGGITALQFLADGRTLATGDVKGQVRLWDLATLQEIATLGTHTGEVMALAVAPQSELLASAAAAEVKLWDLTTRMERSTLKGGARCLAFLEQGRMLVTGGDNRPTLLWDMTTGKLAKPLAQASGALCLAVSPDNQTLALGCYDRTIRLWDVTSRQEHAILRGHTREVTALAFAKDGRALISAAAALGSWFAMGGEIKVWEADSYEPDTP